MFHTAFFEELGVPLDATEAQVRKAYLRKAKKLHPDRNPGDARAKERFQRLERIYRVLSNGELRMAYMRFGEEGLEEEEDGLGGDQAEQADGEEEAEPVTLSAAAELASKLGRNVSEDQLKEIIEEVNSKEYQPSGLSIWSEELVAEEWGRAEAAATPALRWARKQISSLCAVTAVGPRLAASLRVLDLSWNRLEQLPSALAGLTALRELDLSTNQFSQFPACILEMAGSLETLNMERNSLESLPEEFSKLTLLSSASFFGNRIETLPDKCFEGMAGLKQLDLSCNSFTRAPASLVTLRATTDGLNLTCDPNVDFYSSDDSETAGDEVRDDARKSKGRRSGRKRPASQPAGRRTRRRT